MPSKNVVFFSLLHGMAAFGYGRTMMAKVEPFQVFSPRGEQINPPPLKFLFISIYIGTGDSLFPFFIGWHWRLKFLSPVLNELLGSDWSPVGVTALCITFCMSLVTLDLFVSSILTVRHKLLILKRSPRVL